MVRSRRLWRVMLGGVLALVTLVGCGSAPEAAPPPPGPLRILLVNDDGWNAPGTVVLRDALRRAGHRVVVVAPASRRDNDGMAATMSGVLKARKPTRDPDVWSVAGTASDATLFGMRAVMGSQWPALVISGINAGPTVSVTAMQTGTVGAALTAASTSMPAIAVSADVKDPLRPRPEEFKRSADFTVRLVSKLQQMKAAPELMPPRSVLNVNYPGGAAPAGGVAAAPAAPVPSYSMIYRRGSVPGTYTPVPIYRDDPGGQNDAMALLDRDVVLTDLSSDPDRTAPPPRLAARLAPQMQP